jgi:SpoVK/Ycf46/Vps4 family AAA+-type ATPase
MSFDQPRPKITKQWTDIPAISSRPGAKHYNNGMLPSQSGSDVTVWPSSANTEELTSALLQLEDSKNLVARLESELRQLRSKSGSRGADAMKRVENAAKNANTEGQSESDDKEDLSKLKAELERTRVDLKKMGRRVGFDDVIGLEPAKRALREAVIWPAVAHASLFSGIRGSSRGLLLYGPPGCGKTMLARAAAGDLADRAAFFHVRPGDVMSKFYGESQRRILALEELVTESAPAVIFFDEVDSLLGSRDGTNVAEHHRATTNALLAWMDGFGTGGEQVFFLGATNRAEAIDEAALRRFGEAVEVEAPCKKARLALLKHLCMETAAADGHLCGMDEADLEVVAERTDGYSLADVDKLVRRSFLQVLRDIPGGLRPDVRPADVPPVILQHFEAALKESSGTSALRAMLKKRGQERSQL